MPEMQKAGLSLGNVSAGYGATVVLEDLSFDLAAGEKLSIIGRNGVGKTTLLATIMGLTRLHGGRIGLGDRDIAALRPNRRAQAGIGFVPQQREIFPSLTVEENLLVGLRPGAWTLERIYELFPRLQQRRANMGNQLSGGEQQMLAFGRALLTNPRVLLLDEPFEGLAPVIVEQLFHALLRLRDEGGLSIIMVEQHAKLALAFAPRTMVMSRGRIAFDGASRSLIDDPARLDALCGIGGGLH
ncbi:ABC transporter ATP-binding protein [Azospirillum agricola]|uniref:ABC transporter ATP-binding protein n=1 Tax=Azospirillum agricola TaxID=1720247 RepID=UPI000A0F18AC|nr:ABC transporter ATP-binding protein [Azospirillum agricola]SMH62506.1 amino acid/amide ABC transporter ATP-binding protein 2, HAAT family [Azospirillum lipoferum]